MPFTPAAGAAGQAAGQGAGPGMPLDPWLQAQSDQLTENVERCLEIKMGELDDLISETRAAKRKYEEGIARLTRLEKQVKSLIRVHGKDCDILDARVTKVRENEASSHSSVVAEQNQDLKRIRRIELTLCIDGSDDEAAPGTPS